MRVLAGLVVALVVLVAVAALAGPQAGGKAEEASKRGGGELAVPRAALNYAGNHTTLWGKVAALAHYDVVKASEPLTCTNGVANFTCLLSKTDVHPILNALRRVGVNATAAPLNLSHVAVAVFNFTAGQWQWWNVTVLKAWNVTSQHGWAVIVQAPLKKSLGEMLKIHDRAVEKLFKMKNVTSVGILTHRLIVGTSNATDTGEEGRGGNETAKPRGKRPDPAAVERIKKAVKEIDPDVEVEVIYSEPARLTATAGGSFPITFYVDTGIKTASFSCTLGYAGRLWGSASSQVLVTAWHCIAFAGTDRTSPFTITAWGPDGRQYFSLRSGDPKLEFATSTYWWQRSSSSLELYVWSDVVAVGVYDPSFFANNNIEPGRVWYVISLQITGGQVIRFPTKLPVVQQLGKNDVQLFSPLTATWGTKLARGDYARAVGSGTVLSTCWTVAYTGDIGKYGDFVPVAYCHVLTTYMGNDPGDSGSPIYQLISDVNGYPVGVKAYGVLSGITYVFGQPYTVVAPLWLSVNVDVTG